MAIKEIIAESLGLRGDFACDNCGDCDCAETHEEHVEIIAGWERASVWMTVFALAFGTVVGLGIGWLVK